MKGAEATIRIAFPSEKRAAIVWEALGPEAEASPARRSIVEIKRVGRSLIFFFESKDTVALRASINSYMRWIMVIDEVLSKIESIRASQ